MIENIYNKYLQRRAQDNTVKRAVELLKSIISKHSQSTYVSFNGGKDATVVLFLTVIAYKYLIGRLSLPLSKIKTMFFVEPQPFEQVDQFMKEMQQLIGYHEVQGDRDLKKALHLLKETLKIDYVILGSRRTDPYCQHLHQVSPSDTQKGYPQFDRVNPIIDWTYNQVWTFIQTYRLPFCKLYQNGYTYLGNKSNTKQNPQLHHQQRYKPAWEAPDDAELLSRK